MVQWLGVCAFNAECAGSILSQGTKVPQAAQSGDKQINFKRIDLKKINTIPNCNFNEK